MVPASSGAGIRHLVLRWTFAPRVQHGVEFFPAKGDMSWYRRRVQDGRGLEQVAGYRGEIRHVCVFWRKILWFFFF